jgi:hypothetical protein
MEQQQYASIISSCPGPLIVADNVNKQVLLNLHLLLMLRGACDKKIDKVSLKFTLHMKSLKTSSEIPRFVSIVHNNFHKMYVTTNCLSQPPHTMIS